jgi:TetR/AcrR family transcriptional regulator
MKIPDRKEPKTEEKILAAALAEFAAKGLEGARVDHIATLAGVNKAMIYYHFHSKVGLYDAVIRKHLGSVKSIIKQSLDEAQDLEEVFARMADLYASLFESADKYRPIILRDLASGGKHVRKIMLEISGEIGATRKLKALLDRGKREGRFRAADSKQAIISFIGMNLFYLLAAPLINDIWELKNDDKFRRERPQAVVDLFLNGLRAR